MTTVPLSRAVLAAALDSVRFAVGSDPELPMLAGVLVDAEAGGVTFVATEPGVVVRCVLESLALRYRWALDRLEAVTGADVDVVHVVGGGARNRLLCQMTADATRRQVVAGPIEATAAGNLLVQALALRIVGSLAEARELVRRSFQLERYEPRCSERWDEAWARFQGLLDKQRRFG